MTESVSGEQHFARNGFRLERSGRRIVFIFLTWFFWTGVAYCGDIASLYSAESRNFRQTVPSVAGEAFFVLANGTDLRKAVGPNIRSLLRPVKGVGSRWSGKKIREYYCRLKGAEDIQWMLSDLEDGSIVASSQLPERIFFGASTSKVFVAATLLDLQQGTLTKKQLQLMTRMIAVSSNSAWKTLQQMAGNGSADAGREAVDAFTSKMGYGPIRGFQGWLREEVHGNELNAEALVHFLYDTYHNRYPGAEILWKLLYSCRTGNSKGGWYMPHSLYLGGKTGTYSGPNVSPETVPWPDIRARNHMLTFRSKGRQYALVILSNRGENKDVAVLAGGLIREYLHLPRPLAGTCRPH